MCRIFRNGVHGVSSYQGWKYACPQHVEMYRKRKRMKTNA
jgi:hypothetical protein